MHIPFDIEQPAFTMLHTKNISCLYENGNLRFIKAGSESLVDVIYGAVRDANWGTIPYTITQENIRQNEEDFTISYTAHFLQNDILFETICRIEGRADDSLLFEMKGAAQSLFYSNRIGLCVHLPADECNGMPVHIVSDNGEEKQASFPVNISPHQPFSKIQQMQWQTASGNQIQLVFEGDVFEAEDQRNWMDNSYKIYSRPLHLPFPFIVEESYTMQQTILLQFSKGSAIGVTTKKQIEENIFVPMPAIGFAAANKPAVLSTKETSLLIRVPFAQYRAELDFGADWKTGLHIHIMNAINLNTSLELVLFFSDDYVLGNGSLCTSHNFFCGIDKKYIAAS